MVSKSPKTQLCKIIYFDEDSITDYLQLILGGNMEQTTELLETVTKDGEIAASTSAKMGFGNLVKALLGWNAEVGAKASAELGFSGEKMVKNIIKNTILTDFVSILDENDKNISASKLSKGTIKKFSKYKITVEKDSLSYFVMVSPYMNMFQSGSTIPSGELDISLEKLDSVLRNAKGYYEFVGTKGNSKVVLRFNIKAFKNNYMISDLLKMNLSIFAIKVGDTTLDMLNINQELNLDLTNSVVDNPSYEENNLNIDENNPSLKKLPVFDVLLAGVESNDQ